MSNNLGANTATKKRYFIIFLVISALVLSFLFAAGLLGGRATTAQQFIDLQENGQPQFSFRRAHAKGVCITGKFDSTGELANYSTAIFFQAGSYPFVGRFSIAGSNPLAPDLAAPVRSLALSLNHDSGQSWRMAMNTPPVVAVATPEDFYQQIKVLTPLATTGKPNPDKINEFFAAHPETQAFTRWQQSYRPTTSFATEQYHSINAFYLLNKQGARQAIRWAMVPQARAQLQSGDMTHSDKDALQLELAQRLAVQPVRFDLMVTLANEQDDENNPTQAWPKERVTLKAGTVVISGMQPQAEHACNGLVFDPLILPEGMAATQDPILHARSSAYAESYRRRAREVLLDKKVGAQP